MRRLGILAALMLCAVVAAHADSVNIGDIYLLQDDSVGNVTVVVDNLTGFGGVAFGGISGHRPTGFQ